MERLDGSLHRFNFHKYIAEHPYQPIEQTMFHPASASLWTFGQIQSSATREALECWRVDFHVPSDVSFYVPTDDERADQPPEGMLAVSKMVMEAGLRVP
ncbi:hypothetical protein OROMI_001216 [Orobanche minor]